MTEDNNLPTKLSQSIHIGLVNPKSASNVAVILRAAGCFGVQSILYTGKRYTHAKQFHEDTKNFRQTIPNEAVESLITACPNNAKKVVIELTEGAKSLTTFKHPDDAFYIFGPEDGTVPQSIIDVADHVVYIPTNSSLNLAVTANIVLYDRLAKSEFVGNDELIKLSRDRNNSSIV